MSRAANSVADSKHADQPAAKSCSQLVPVPGLPGRDSLTSRRPSELRDAPSRPPVVWAFAVYSTFSICVMIGSFSSRAMTGSLRTYSRCASPIQSDVLHVSGHGELRSALHLGHAAVHEQFDA